jgi:hypothetical protein
MPSPRRAHRAILAAALAAALAGCAARRGGAATASRPERFEVPGDGAIELPVPAGWNVTVRPGEGDAAAPTVRLEPGRGQFAVLLTPFLSREGGGDAGGEGSDGDASTAETAQALAELARRRALQTSVEHEIGLEEIRGDEVHGYWFAATDKALQGTKPEPGEWAHVVQGAAAVGDLILAFTLLDNGPGPQRRQVLEMVRGARQVPPEPGGAPATASDTPGFEPDPSAATVPLAVAYPGRDWTVLVDLPGFQMFKPRSTEDGIGVIVLGEDPATGLVASVALRAAGEAPDARACRERALEGVRRAAPALRELKLVEPDGTARASYVLHELRGRPIRQDHAHAFLARDGVCVNVHVSKAQPAPEDAERIERILSSVRFGEAL